mgnify:CR=1 FL=1
MKPRTHSHDLDYPENDYDPLVDRDMLVGNDWRHLVLSHKTAQKLIQRTQHRGYTLEPYDNR